MALAAAGRSRRAAPHAGLLGRLKSAAGAHAADAQLLPRRAFVRLRRAGSWTPAFAALDPRHRKLLAVRVRINIANSQVCRARKHAVVSAALRDLVVCVRELAWRAGPAKCTRTWSIVQRAVRAWRPATVFGMAS